MHLVHSPSLGENPFQFRIHHSHPPPQGLAMQWGRRLHGSPLPMEKIACGRVPMPAIPDCGNASPGGPVNGHLFHPCCPFHPFLSHLGHTQFADSPALGEDAKGKCDLEGGTSLVVGIVVGKP